MFIKAKDLQPGDVVHMHDTDKSRTVSVVQVNEDASVRVTFTNETSEVHRAEATFIAHRPVQ